MRTTLSAAMAPLRIGSRATRTPLRACTQCRAVQLSASPSTEARPTGDAFGPGRERDDADARFEVLGAPYSLLSITLSASQKLYTRRGSLVALAGKPDSTQSTLSLLSPLARLPLGIPFLYQRVTSASPVTALVSTRSPHTTFSVLRLDGTTDWIVSQRGALLAWTGHALHASPRLRHALPVAHWGATLLAGRGLAALCAPGQIYELQVGPGETFVAHPAHVVAYSMTKSPPLPFRFRSSGARLQVPETVSSWFASIELVRRMRKTQAYGLVARAARAVRTALRRTIWGDRLFLQFTGPITLLVSSRGRRIADVLTNSEVNEIASVPAGGVDEAIDKATTEAAASGPSEKAGAEVQKTKQSPPKLHVVTVRRDGKVIFEDGKDLKDFIQ